ncbi:MAG TPA: glycosyltransferase family 4 protein [Marmoricola sp.]|nr:glycosyltransferase family 4 protein [Marmoricola sp.]
MSRVLLVGKGAPDRGGIPTFLEDLLGGIVSREHDVTFLNVAHAGTPQGGNVTVGNLVRTLRDAWAIWRMARHHDLVHINSAAAPGVTVARAGLLAAAARARRRAVVVHVHGGNVSTWLASRRHRLLMRTAMAPVHRVVAVWNAGSVALTGVLGPERVRLVQNGVDPLKFAGPDVSHEPPRVLYVGLLTPRKGVLELIEASARLRGEGVDHELRLLGGTPDEGPTAARPVLDAAEGKARLLGTLPPHEVPGVYAEADVFCLPSWWEAMPMSVLEAMAAGLPVVATDVGDVARLVDDGRTGFVIPPRSPEQLVAALRKLLTDPARARAMGAEGRSRVQARFSAAVSARAVCEVYVEALAARR